MILLLVRIYCDVCNCVGFASIDSPYRSTKNQPIAKSTSATIRIVRTWVPLRPWRARSSGTIFDKARLPFFANAFAGAAAAAPLPGWGMHLHGHGSLR